MSTSSKKIHSHNCNVLILYGGPTDVYGRRCLRSSRKYILSRKIHYVTKLGHVMPLCHLMPPTRPLSQDTEKYLTSFHVLEALT